jgi:hypothetical protein
MWQELLWMSAPGSHSLLQFWIVGGVPAGWHGHNFVGVAGNGVWAWQLLLAMIAIYEWPDKRPEGFCNWARVLLPGFCCGEW